MQMLTIDISITSHSGALRGVGAALGVSLEGLTVAVMKVFVAKVTKVPRE